MSQAKVDRYKEEKANRKKILAKEKRKRIAGTICGWLIALLIVGWAGYSGYNAYEKSKPIKTIYADLDAINNYDQHRRITFLHKKVPVHPEPFLILDNTQFSNLSFFDFKLC